MKTITALFGASLIAGVMSLAAIAQAQTKVGFVYIGTPGDGGWTYEHDVGRKAVQEHFGTQVETTFVENVPEGADAERVLTQMALSGHDLIFTTSFGYMDATLNVAKKFPNVKFEHATGYKRADNVTTYSARFYEGRTVIGHIAGKMTQSSKIGYIASFPIPEVIRGINAAYLAAKKANPNVEMKIVWVFTWYDPAKEGDAAKALVDQGVDVIMQHTDSTAAMAVAEQAGVLAFGQASDMYQYAPEPRISSIIDNWSPYYINRVQAVIDGTWASQDTWWGIKEGMVGIGEITDVVPAAIKAEAMQLRDDLASGAYHAFTGPINKQDGSAWLSAGEIADDGTLLGMNFYVEGIEGDIPQ